MFVYCLQLSCASVSTIWGNTTRHKNIQAKYSHNVWTGELEYPRLAVLQDPVGVDCTTADSVLLGGLAATPNKAPSGAPLLHSVAADLCYQAPLLNTVLLKASTGCDISNCVNGSEAAVWGASDAAAVAGLHKPSHRPALHNK